MSLEGICCHSLKNSMLQGNCSESTIQSLDGPENETVLRLAKVFAVDSGAALQPLQQGLGTSTGPLASQFFVTRPSVDSQGLQEKVNLDYLGE